MRYNAGRPYAMTEAQMLKMPSVFITMSSKGMTVEIKPTAYFEKVKGVADTYKPRLFLDEWSGATLGANTMQDHDVVFDVENKRMGWARADCLKVNHTAAQAWRWCATS